MIIVLAAGITGAVMAQVHLETGQANIACYAITTVIAIICIIAACDIRIEGIWKLQIVEILIIELLATFLLIAQIACDCSQEGLEEELRR